MGAMGFFWLSVSLFTRVCFPLLRGFVFNPCVLVTGYIHSMSGIHFYFIDVVAGWGGGGGGGPCGDGFLLL